MKINTTDGRVWLYRRTIHSSLWQDVHGAMLFLTLLQMAHHEDNVGSVRMRGKQRPLKKGQLVISRNELSEFLGWPASTVRNALNRLKEDKRVDSESDKQKTIITICNWEKYQVKQDKAEDKKQDNDRTTSGQRQDNVNLSQKKTTSKEVKNTVSKDTGAIAQYGRNDINDLMAYFEELMGFAPSKGKMNRYALKRMLDNKKLSVADIKRLLQGAKTAQDEDVYAPRVFNYLDLESKMANIVDYYRRKEQSTNTIAVIE
jgi:DNA-binding transcriptional regulator YhcF (GntR family)